MVSINSKLPGIGTNIFSVMSKLATEHNAINLSQGFPDFPCDPELIKIINSTFKGNFNQYAPMPGTMLLRERIAEKNEKLYRSRYNPDTEVTVTSGATQAIFTAIATVINPGDE
ncbi:MAG: aminotransferase class I/II-fold pyridoxal phosphate-dependent enzyme, partial [Pedobacter sp.]